MAESIRVRRVRANGPGKMEFDIPQMRDSLKEE